MPKDNPSVGRTSFRCSVLKTLNLHLVCARFFAIAMLLLTASLSGANFGFTPTRVSAQTPNTTVNYQARLLTSAGAVVPDGNYHIEFKIYDDISAGATAQGVCTGNCLWVETRSTGNLVRVVNGYVSVNLGSVTAFPSTMPWSQNLYITMRVGGNAGSASWDTEMTNSGNRMKVNSTPLAYVANNLASSNTNAASTNSSNISIQTGNALGTTSNSGNILVDSGTATGTTGTITLGATNASAITIGRNGLNTAIAGSLSVASLGTTDTSTFLCRNSSNILAGCSYNPLSSSLTDNITDAFDLQEGTNNYFNINTTNGGENISFGNAVTNPSYNFLGSGTLTINGDLAVNGDDITSDGVLTINAASYVRIGEAGTPTYASNNNDLYVEGILEVGQYIFSAATGSSDYGLIVENASTNNNYPSALFYQNSGSADFVQFANNSLTPLSGFRYNGQLYLGSPSGAESTQGALDFYGASGTNYIRLQSVATPTANRTISLPNEDGIVCLQGSSTCGYALTSLTDNATDALDIQEGTNNYININTTNSSENISFGNATTNPSFNFLGTGTLAVAGSQTVAGNLTVDTSTLFVDSASDFVSVGSTSDLGGRFQVVGANDETQLLVRANATQSFSNPLVLLQNSAGSELARINATTSSLFFGNAAGGSSAAGVNNTGIGASALGSVSTGTGNTTLGSGALASVSVNNNNTAVGYNAGNLATGSNNIFLGALAGDNVTTGSDNIIIGYNLDASAAGVNNELRIGGVLQGNTSTLAAQFNGALAVNGNTVLGDATTDRLTVTAQILGGSPLVFQGATDNGFATTLAVTDPTANNTITLPDASGTVQLAPTSGSFIRQVPTSTADNTITPTANSVVGLTINGTSGTAATALSVVQGGAATAFQVNSTSTGNILTLQDNGTNVLTVADGGTTTITANGGANVGLVVNNDGSTGNILNVQDGGINVATFADGGAVTFQNTTNSTSAFRVLNGAGTTTAFSVDSTNARVGVGTSAPNATLQVSGNQSTTALSVGGMALRVTGATYTDTGTAASGTVSIGVGSSFGIPTIAATNSNVTYTNAATLYIAGPPSAGSNVTITNPYALYISSGNSIFGGDITTSTNLQVNGNTILGNASTDRLTVTAQILGGSPLVFQGATDNGFATTLAVTDPTANNTITLPDQSGTVLLGASGTGNALVQVPSSNTAGAQGANVIAPTAAGITGLTVNGTTGTAATALSIVQGGAATALSVSGSSTGNLAVLDTSNASANGLLVDVQSASTQYIVRATSNNGATTVLDVLANGNISLGTTSSTTTVNGNLNVSSNTLFVSATNSRVAVGTSDVTNGVLTIAGTAPNVANGAGIRIDTTLDSTTQNQNGMFVRPIVSPASASTRTYAALNFAAQSSSANISGASLMGIFGGSSFSGTGTLGAAYGAYLQNYNNTSGTISDSYALYIDSPSNAGTITRNYGAVIVNQTGSASTNANLVLGNVPTSGNWSLYSQSAYNSAIAGNLRIGSTTAPTVALDVTGAGVFSGNLTVNGNTILGDASTDRLTVTAQILGGSPLVFQGATDNGFATTLAVTDPTANNTITLPDQSGTVLLGASGTGNALVQVPSSNTAGAQGANVIAPTAAGITGLTVNGTTGTAATALSIVQGGAASAITVAANNLTTQTAASITSTGVLTGTGNLLTLTANSATTATGLLTVNGTGLTQGYAQSINVNSATTLTTGGALNITGPTGAANLTGGSGLLRVSATGAFTTTAGVGGLLQVSTATVTGTAASIVGTGTMTTTGNLLTLTANSATTATGLLTINGTGLTSGSALNINAGTATAISAGGNIIFRELTGTRTLGVQTRTTAGTAGTNLTVSAGSAATTGTFSAGGILTLQGGAASGATGTSANGGNVVIAGGAGAGSGVSGLVVISNPTFQTATVQNFTSSGNITQANIDSNGAILISSNAAGYTATMGDPTITTAGRVVYVTNSGTFDMTLSVNGGGSGNTITLKPSTTATMIWNGSDWTAAGASSSTDLQAAYNNTATSAGGAELVLNAPGGSADGLTIRNNGTTPIIGGLLEVQSAIGSNLFTVNNNAIEYANNGGAESATFTMWTGAFAGGAVTRNTTALNVATGQGSVSVVTSGTGHGAENTLTTTLTPNLQYDVAYTIKGNTNFSTLETVYSRDGTNTLTTSCNSAQTVTTSQFTRVNCTFTAPSSGITASNSIFIRQTDATGRTFYIDNLSVTVSADVNHAADGSVDVALGSNWTNFGANTSGTTAAVRNTTVLYDTSGSVEKTTGATADRGVVNNLTIAPATSTQYLVTFYARSSNTFNDIRVRYSRDGGTNFVSCTDYNTQSVSTTAYTRITCIFTTDGTTATNADLIIDQPTATARTFYIDALTVSLNTNNSNNVQIGGGSRGGPTTLFTLDRSNGAPIAANNDAYLGSMYYDTSTGRIQCYEADGWGACGAAPDNIVNLNPEYAGAVLNGSGVGTMTADFCGNGGGLSTNTSLCASGESRNFYRWTSPQATQQTYSIYVTYQLPTTFNGFSSDDTIQLTGRVDSTTNAAVTYEVFRSTGSSITQCGTGETNVITTPTGSAGVAGTWYSYGINGNESTGCGFNSSAAGNFVIFKINLKANSNANAYVSTLSFTTTGR